ncbi:MAG TPA: 7,8-didemethyl-8-hydroxy-5-deazariboflavin synthase, partial [Acidimicrobiia bacterium]
MHPAPDRELAVAYLDGSVDAAGLFGEAVRLRDEGHGRIVSYSRKVFIPLTTLCRDTCTYCTFAKPPGAGGMYLEPEDVLAVAAAGDAHRCTEALFTLGDRPEARWRQAR